MSRKLFPIALGLTAAILLAMTIALASPDAFVRVAGSFASLPNEDATITTTTPMTGQGKIALAIARAFSVTVQDVLDVRNKDMGWGEVEKVFALAKLSGKTPAQIVELRLSGLGWGELEKQLGLHPGAGPNLGQVLKGNKDNQTPNVHPDDPKPPHQDDDKDEDKNQKQNHDNGHGKDNGKHKGK